jgi:hypothetical protein
VFAAATMVGVVTMAATYRRRSLLIGPSRPLPA